MAHKIKSNNNLKSAQEIVLEFLKLKLKRVTQSDIAKELGYSQSYISKILNGKFTPKNFANIIGQINLLMITKNN